MALNGQASGGWTESSSALRLLHVGVRNTVGVLTADSFTQSNPPVDSTHTSTQVDVTAIGVLGGSIAFTRPDEGSNYIGGPTAAGAGAGANTMGERVLGVFINSANGNAYENTPGVASGKGPYVSGQGTYGNALYETSQLGAANVLVYAAGDRLAASKNGFLTNHHDAASLHGNDGGQIIGILKMAPDAAQNELVYDQRI